MPLPIFIDVEASSLSKASYPIQIAFNLGETIHSFLIRPAEGWEDWDDSAEAVHGWSRSRLLSEGEPAFLVAKKINDLLAGKTVYSDAKDYDGRWVDVLFDEIAAPRRFRVEDYALLYGSDRRRIDEVRQALERERPITHRADEDVAFLMALHRRLVTEGDGL